MLIPIDEFARRLAEIPAAQFTGEAVLAFLVETRVDPLSLEPYLYFSSEHYTRNLIQRTELYELIAICWEVGQRSAIHNHRDQSCWMAVPYGKLQVHNFKLVRKDPSSGTCELASSDHFIMEPGSPQAVDPDEPIHQVVNPSSFSSRSVSLHIYSRPFDTCEVYDLKANHYQDVKLVNTSEYGVLVTREQIQRVLLPLAAE
ncbi:MAG: cysteine dioxygenase family protein [Acidobacteria bacterium]|nr:cysteine dioxygenase family protein [Acidobacteriota bacterium]